MKVNEITITEKEYEEMLDDTYGTVEICGMTFNSGEALKELDPIAFDCGLSDLLIRYECGECSTVFEDSDEAEECCKEED